MVAIYGNANGFGWKVNEIAAAQVVSVPLRASAVRAGHIRRLFLLPFACLLVVMYVSINLLLHFVVIRPIERISDTAEAVSMGTLETPEFTYQAGDEIGRLSASFTRMHRSVVEAFRLLGQSR
jgi:protein-histidine pros-kinase